MRTLSLVIPISIVLAISACSLIWDEDHTPHILGPDAGHHPPDASLCHNDGGCFIPDATDPYYPDATYGSDGGHYYPDASVVLPDGGIVGDDDAGSYGWDAH